MGTAPLVKTNGTKAGQMNVVATASGTGKSIFNSIFSAAHRVWIDEVDSETNTPYPRTEKLKFKSDPLALVIGFRASGMENWAIAEKLSLSTSYEVLAHKDSVAQAEKVKRYYKNRFMLKALKQGEQNMSRFRRNLYDFVESDDPYTIYKNDIPMIVKLPDFYEEDCAMDNLAKEYNMTASDYSRVVHKLDSSFDLTPVARIDRNTKNSKDYNYYFADSDDKVYRISLKPDNPLLHLFEKEFGKERVTIQGNAMTTVLRGTEYGFYNLTAWQLV